MFSNISVEFESIITTEKLTLKKRAKKGLHLASLMPLWPNNVIGGFIELQSSHLLNMDFLSKSDHFRLLNFYPSLLKMT